MGIFTVAAGGLAAREQGMRDAEERARIETERTRRQQQEDEDRKIRQAALLASLNSSNIVANGQRDVEQSGDVPGLRGPVSPGGAAAVLPATPNLTKLPGVDESRYTKLGDTGYSLDEKPALSFAERRALDIKEQGIRRRMAALRARSPEYKAMPDDALRGIAEDNTTYSEAFKPKPVVAAPRTIPTKDGIKQWNPTTGQYELMTGPDGKPEQPFTPPRVPRRDPNLPTPEQPSVVKQREHDAIMSRVRVRQTQMAQLDKAIELAPTAAGPDSTVNKRALDSLKTQRGKYQKEVDDLMAKDAPAAPAGGLPITPVVDKPAPVDPTRSARAAWGLANPPRPGETREAYKARGDAAMVGHR